MNNFTMFESSDESICPQNCGQVEFEYIATTDSIDVAKACKERTLPGLQEDELERREGELFWLTRLVRNPEEDLCRARLANDLAYMTFEIVNPRIQKVIKRRRVTFTDMLGNLGT